MRSASAQKPPEIFAPIPDSESGVITPLVNHAAKTECLLLPILLQTSGNNLSQFADVPRKGNVDRNAAALLFLPLFLRTFPARGTWIEIPTLSLNLNKGGADVPRKGNVDRNGLTENGDIESLVTFPARGTWIEIIRAWNRRETRLDVPRKGNVDRNFPLALRWLTVWRTFPARGTWIEMPRE